MEFETLGQWLMMIPIAAVAAVMLLDWLVRRDGGTGSGVPGEEPPMGTRVPPEDEVKKAA
jgi:hypothetical protein